MITTLTHARYSNRLVVRFPEAILGKTDSPEIAPPLLGEHTAKILRRIGLTRREISSLRSRSVI